MQIRISRAHQLELEREKLLLIQIDTFAIIIYFIYCERENH